jgi:penicillin-binding protein 1A
MRTTLDSRLQTAARVALMKGLEAYDRRHGWRGAWGRVSAIAPGWEAAALKKTPPSERR